MLRPTTLAATFATAAAALAQAPAATVAIERELTLRGGPSHGLAWSADGRWLASGGDCGEVLVLDAATGAVRHELTAGPWWIGTMQFAPDGQTLATIGEELILWDLATGTARARARCCGPHGLAWSRDGRWLATAVGNDTVQVRHAADLTHGPTLHLGDGTAIDAVAFAPDGQQLAVGKRSGTTTVFALPGGTPVRTIRQDGYVQALAWLDDGRLLRLQPNPADLFGWGEPIGSLGKYAWGLAAEPRGRLALCWNSDGVTLLRPGELPTTLREPGPAAVHPDGATWAQAQATGVTIRRGTSVQRTLPLRHRAAPKAAALVGDGQHLAVGDGQSITVFRLADGTPLHWPGEPLRGMPVDYRAGAELAVWTPPRPADQSPAAGEWTLWSLAAVAKGRAEPTRRVLVLEPSRWEWSSSLALAADGRHLALGTQIVDLHAAGNGGWEVPFGLHQQVAPLPGGTAALSLEWQEDGLFGWDEGTRLEVSRCRTPDGAKEVLGTFAAARNTALDPTGARLGVLRDPGLQVCTVDPWRNEVLLEGDWQGFCWLDATRVLVLSARGQVQVVPVDGGPPGPLLQLPGCGWVLGAAAGSRAVAWRRNGTLLVLRIGAR